MNSDTSLKGLAQSLIDEVTLLIRQELRLAKAEVSEDINRAQRSVVMIVAGLLLGFCALLILLQAIVIALAEIMPGWLASIIVALVVGGTAAALIKSGQKTLTSHSMVPERTIRSVKRDKDLVVEKAS
jgi:uncharacterized membrane protein YqjE